MKTLTVYCDKDLVLRWNEWPDQLKQLNNHSVAWENAAKEYEADLELAKRDSKPFEDQNYVREILGNFLDPHNKPIIKPETFYSFPFDGNAKIKGDIARLVPSEPEESQEELFRDVLQRLYDCLERGHGSLKSILNDFLITRKHP